MKASTRSAVLLIPILSLIALTGCAPGSSTPGSDGSSESDGAGGGDGDTGSAGGVGDCAAGHVWSADVDDMADQLLTFMTSSGGMAVQSVSGEGTQLLTWNTDNTVSIDTDYAFTVLADLEDGLVMTMVQSHNGPSTGSLTIDGATAIPSNWDNTGYTIETTVDINGMSTDMAIDLPATGIDEGITLDIECSGSTMTTVAEGGLFYQNWTRTD